MTLVFRWLLVAVGLLLVTGCTRPLHANTLPSQSSIAAVEAAAPIEPLDTTGPALVHRSRSVEIEPEPEPEPLPEPVADGPSVPVEAGTWRIIVPEINLDAFIIDTGLEADGSMEAPAGPDDVGWYRYGGAPGSTGNALLGGHVDWTDRVTGRPHGAVFWSLRQLQVGSLVVFTDGTQEFTYAVTEKRRYRWDDPAGVDVLQPETDSRLTLITCGGVFNRATRSYDMRDVIIAHRVA